MKLLLPWIVAGLSVARLAAADEAAVKTHTLFMGADIDLQQASGFYHVENVEGGSFVIKVDGKEKKIPMKFSTVKMKVDHNLKLSEASVNVENLVVDRAYSLAADPNVKYMREASAAAGADAVRNLELQRMLAANGISAMKGTPGAMVVSRTDQVESNAYGLTEAENERQISNANASYATANFAIGSDINSAGVGANKLEGTLAEGMYDAIEIKFQVSSPKPLNSPYAVVLAQFSAPGAKPSEVQNWVYATELDPITPETRIVHIKQGGFPPGFELKSHQIHLYNRGQELASTVASKRVELTRDEAFDYVLIDYLSSNKGKTLPATLAMGRLPVQVRNNAQAGGPLFVQVDKAGLPVAAFSDEACVRKIDDPALEAALRTLRFKPALKEGKVVAGVARLGSS